MASKKHSLRYSEEAAADLERISDYYLLHAGPSASEKICDGILNAALDLEESPYLGSRHPDSFLSDRGYHVLFAGDFAIEYLIMPEIIWVSGVYPQKSDWLPIE